MIWYNIKEFLFHFIKSVAILGSVGAIILFLFNILMIVIGLNL